MKQKDNDYIFLSTRVKAMERGLLTKERIEQMLDAPTTEAAAKVLKAIDKITPNIEVVVTVSADAADLPEELKKFII